MGRPLLLFSGARKTALSPLSNPRSIHGTRHSVFNAVDALS